MYKFSASAVHKETSQTLTLSRSLVFWLRKALMKDLPTKSLPDVGPFRKLAG